MSTAVHNPSPDTLPAHSKPLTAIKPQRKSRKAPGIKADVITRRVQGFSKRSISKELGITRNTVDTILEESHIEQHLRSGQEQSVELIPEAIRVARFKLSQNSENMAIKVLENTIWPLDSKTGPRAMTADTALHLAINNLIQVPAATTNSASADKEPAIIDVPSQVVDNK